MKRQFCIARGCRNTFDTTLLETRLGLRSFWQRYCPTCRTLGNAGCEPIVSSSPLVESTPVYRTAKGISVGLRKLDRAMKYLTSPARSKISRDFEACDLIRDVAVSHLTPTGQIPAHCPAYADIAYSSALSVLAVDPFVKMCPVWHEDFNLVRQIAKTEVDFLYHELTT